MAGRQGSGNGDADFTRRRGRRGFAHLASLARPGLGKAAARRGLSELRLLTHWAEIAGPDVAAICLPQRISHRGRALAGTLIVQARPGRGPEIDMMAPQIIERVNACLGYGAVNRLRVAHASAAGFAEAQAAFDAAGAPPAQLTPDARTRERVAATVAKVADAELRATLERLGLAIAMRNSAGRS